MDEVRLFLVVCSNRRKSNGLKLEHRKFCTNMQKNFFTVRVMEHWNRLPRGRVESPMEIFETLCDLLQDTCFSRGGGLYDLEVPSDH